MKDLIFIIIVIILSITGCSLFPKLDEEIFQEALNVGTDSICGLLGTEIDTSQPSKKIFEDMDDNRKE